MSDSLAKVRALLELGKLRLASLAIFAVVAGLYLAAWRPLPFGLVLATTVGTLLVAAGGNALNMYFEREPDARMRRTQGRPLPTGRLTPRTVMLFGVLLAVVGSGLLWWWTNALATALCAAIFVTYVWVYTPLKRITPFNTLVGAIPGALPPVVGYAAETGQLDQKAVVLFLILFFWQIPHFLAIAWRHREDYARGGMKMLPSVDPDGRLTAVQMLVYTLALILATLYAWQVGLARELYLLSATFLGLLLLVPVVLAAWVRKDHTMRMVFRATIVYLPLLLGVMVLDRARP